MSISSVNGVASTVSRYRFVAAGGETSLSGDDANGSTLSYLAGKEEVYLNGALLVRGQDYTGTDGATISSLTALVAGDTVEIITFVPFAIPTAISSSTVTTKGDLIVATGAGAVTRLGVGTDTYVLTASSTASTGLTWAAGPTGPALNEQVFTSSGTWTAPTGVTKAWVQIVGAGGGGGDSSSSQNGGGGQPGVNYTGQFTVTPGTGYTVTIGAAPASRSTGGTSSFNGTNAVGGGPGAYAAGGSGTGFNCYGAGGSVGTAAGSATTASNAASNSGAGGGGLGANGTDGGNCKGGSGIVIVRWLA